MVRVGTGKAFFILHKKILINKNKNGETTVDFINIEYFGNDFTKLKNYVLKGDKVGVIGSLHVEKGDNKFFTKIKANKLELLGTKNSEKNKNLHFDAKKEQKVQEKINYSPDNTLKGAEFDTNGDDEDVPF